MGRFLHRRPTPDPADDGAGEDPVVRQYRYLLRTAPPDALEAAHGEALRHLATTDRVVLLATAQDALVAGLRLTVDDHDRLAHLMTVGELRTPGVLLAAYPAGPLRALAGAVIHSEATFGLFGGYAGWDGADPEPEDDSAWADGGFDPDSGRWNVNRMRPKDIDSRINGASPGFINGVPPGYGGGP
jgi:hypothetical protein